MARPLIGQAVRRLRQERGLSQAALASRLGISASYLNLLEHDRRAVTASVLIKLTRALGATLETLSGDQERQLATGVREALSDPSLGIDPVPADELAAFAAHPAASRAVIARYRALRVAREEASGIALPSGRRIRLPAEEARQFYQDRMNHFPSLEAASAAVRARLQEDEAGRGGGLLAPALMNHAIAERLRRPHGLVVTVSPLEGATRRFDPVARHLALSDILPRESRGFHLAFQLMLIEAAEPIMALVRDAGPSSPEAAMLIRIGLTNYAAAALLMPFAAIVETAETLRYDVEMLAARFSVSYEQAAQRLSTLQSPTRQGVPLFFARIDPAANITKSFSIAGFPIGHHAGSCPRWIGNTAFTTPDTMRVQVARFTDGSTFLCFARTVRARALGWSDVPPMHVVALGCDIAHAGRVVYADGIDIDGSLSPVGISCRLCDWQDCRSRAHPPLEHRLALDPHERSLSRFPFVREPD